MPPDSAFISILRDPVRRLDVVLGTLYMIPKGLRSADFCIAYVSCEERWTSTVGMEASVGSLKCSLMIMRFCEHPNAAAGVGLAVCWWSFPSYGTLQRATSLGYRNKPLSKSICQGRYKYNELEVHPWRFVGGLADILDSVGMMYQYCPSKYELLIVYTLCSATTF